MGASALSSDRAGAPLAGTAAIVTGAASGLGLTTATQLREAGAKVVGIDLDDAVDSEVNMVTGSIANPNIVDSALERVKDFGLPLRTVVNCAGIRSFRRVVSEDGPFPLDHFRNVLEVNLVGTFNMASRAANEMALQEPDDDGVRGVIINTASIAAYEGLPGQSAYTASKAAVAGLTLQLARDLSEHGIRVLAIAPGVMETPILATITEERKTALTNDVVLPRRLGKSEEFAQLVLALILNPYMNGEVVRLDGALRMNNG